MFPLKTRVSQEQRGIGVCTEKLTPFAVFAFVVVAIVTEGCTYAAVAPGTSAPSGEIRVDRYRDVAIASYVEADSLAMNKEAKKNSWTCSAHKYPIDIDAGLRQTIRNVLEDSFASVDSIDTAVPSEGNYGYILVFRLDEFDPVVSYSSGFWSGTFNADVSIVMKVRVLSGDGSEILRTTVSGDGDGSVEGGCSKGGEALSQAAGEALEELLENFVYKVINSDLLDTDV